MAEIVSRGMAEIDPEAGLVVLTKALIVNGRVRDTSHPGSPNGVKSWATALSKLRSCPLRDLVAARIAQAMTLIGGQYPSVFAEAMAESCTTVVAIHVPPIPGSIRDSGIRDQGSGIPESLSHSAREVPADPEPAAAAPPVAAPAPGEIGALIDSAVDRMNAARTKLDPEARPIGPFEDQPGRDQLRQRLRATDATKRATDLDHCVRVLISEAGQAGDVGKLRLGMLGGPAAWPRLLAGSVKAPTPAARAGPRFANDRQAAPMPPVGKGPTPITVSAADRAAAADELKKSREALGIVAGLSQSLRGES
jgi:hypothetical protein